MTKKVLLLFVLSTMFATAQTTNSKLKTAYFASGCFWCVESIYENLIGVEDVVNGYSGGHTQNPTYASSNTGLTGHAEAVAVTYNPNKISFKTLVEVYFASQNPTQVNGQGPDRGSQYRSIIFYKTDAERQIILSQKKDLSKRLLKPIAAEIMEFDVFWVAEKYHQNYKKLHPNNSYIQKVSVPRFRLFARKFPQLLKK